MKASTIVLVLGAVGLPLSVYLQTTPILTSLGIGIGVLLTSYGLKQWEASKFEKQCQKIIRAGNPTTAKTPHILVVVNPIGGARRGLDDMASKFLPKLAAASRRYRVIVTQHGDHPREIGASLDPALVTELAVLGGDGMLNQIIQGLTQNPDKRAMDIPIGICPCGTGNGVATSLGLDTPSRTASQLVAGRVSPLDALWVHHDDPSLPRVGALSVTWGTVADHDQLTEVDYRHLGPLRLVVAPLLVIGRLRFYKGRVTLLTVKDWKRPANETSFEADCHKECDDPVCHRNKSPTTNATLPSSKRPTPSEWDNIVAAHDGNTVVIEDYFLSLVASSVSHIASDARATPYAHLADGTVDVMMIRGRDCMGRFTLAKMFIDAEDGSHLKHPALEYYKVKAMMIEPEVEGVGYMAVDGETCPAGRLCMVADHGRFKAVCA